ncbi:MAG: signal peptidase II [Proteobacteria bacterium]|nr:signal peptidase II [Pseudomonadota bacterium]MCL2307105.1 signal peptidase II [Pseudomonadota bacterium]
MPEREVPPWSKDARYDWNKGWWLLISVLVVVFDRLTKLWVYETFYSGEIRPVTSFFSLILTFNTGAAFSFLAGAGGWQRPFFVVISVVACLAFSWLLLRGGSRRFSLGLVLIIGGALGNLWDRIAYGRVIDFLLFHYQQWSYPAFNIADSAIVVGAVLLFADGLRQRKYAVYEDQGSEGRGQGSEMRHCEERSDEAIQKK